MDDLDVLIQRGLLDEEAISTKLDGSIRHVVEYLSSDEFINNPVAFKLFKSTVACGVLDLALDWKARQNAK